MMTRRRHSMNNYSYVSDFDTGPVVGSGVTFWSDQSSLGVETTATFLDSERGLKENTSKATFNNWILKKDPKKHKLDEPPVKNDTPGDKNRFKTLLSGFADRTSMVGVAYIHTSVSKAAKFLWLVLLLSAIGAMIFHLIFLFQQYYSWPKQTKVTIEFSNLPPPAITICNVNPLRMSKVSRASENLENLIRMAHPHKYKLQMEQILLGDQTTPTASTTRGGDGGDTVTSTLGNSVTEQTTTSASGGRGGGRTRGATTATDAPETTSAATVSNAPDNSVTDETTTSTAAPTTRGGGGGRTRRTGNRVRRFAEDLLALNLTNAKGKPITSDDDPIVALRSTYKKLYMRESRDNRFDMGHQLKTMLLQCSINGRRCNKRNFTSFQSEGYGNCFTLQSNYSTIEEPGADHGVQMILFLETEEYIHGITDGYGARVVIHEPHTVPFPEEEGFFIPAGYETNVGLKMISVDRLGPPFGTCRDEEEFFLEYGVKYTFQTCLSICRAKHIIDACQCIGPRTQEYLFRSNMTSGVGLCISTKEKNCASKFAERYRSKSLPCDCPQSCRENEYTKFMSAHQYPTSDYVYMLLLGVCDDSPVACRELTNIISNPNLLSLNFLKISVYYEDLNYEQITETPEIEKAQFLSDVGGALGLWIGLSLISVFELLQLVGELFNVFVLSPSPAHVRPRKWQRRHHTWAGGDLYPRIKRHQAWGGEDLYPGDKRHQAWTGDDIYPGDKRNHALIGDDVYQEDKWHVRKGKAARHAHRTKVWTT